MKRRSILEERLNLFSSFLETNEPISYGHPVVRKPSQFWPDEEMNIPEEIERWKRDLQKEKAGKSDFEYGWGLGTSFGKSIDIEKLLSIFS
ncbi:hypothetical protein BSNK01_12440 [Bacillaceae bacterium]